MTNEKKLVATIPQTYRRCVDENIGISKHLLRQLVNSGEIPSVRAGNQRLIHWGKLMQYLESGTTATVEEEPPGIRRLPEDVRKL